MLFTCTLTTAALAEPPGSHWLSNGSKVEVDILMNSTPGSSVWRTGKIVEVTQRMNSYKVDVEGVQYTIVNSDKWIKASSAPAPQNSATAEATSGANATVRASSEVASSGSGVGTKPATWCGAAINHKQFDHRKPRTANTGAGAKERAGRTTFRQLYLP